MPRTVSATLRSAAYAQQTSECPLVLLTIDHPDLAAPIRVVADAQGVTSGGDDYVAYPFAIALPDDADDKVPSTRLVIDNVDRQIIQAIRSIGSAATLTMQVVLASDPDVIEAGPFSMTLRNVSYNSLTIEGDLQGPNLLQMQFPKRNFTPNDFNGLF